MGFIAIGCDVSKGRCDVAIINESGTLLAGSGGYDDNRRDHERLRRVLIDLRDANPEAEIMVGLEATGGLERNWIAFFRDEKRWEKLLLLHRINPLALRRYLTADLHRSVTDASAARGIARFLMERCRGQRPSAPLHEGAVSLYRLLRSAIQRRMELKHQFLALLVSTNAELVQYTRAKLPDWVVAVVKEYPTAKHLARASVEVLDRIPYVDPPRAEALIAAAKTSVSAMTDDGAADAMRFIVRQLYDLEEAMACYRARLERMLADDPRIARLDTITAVGKWSAICLVLEIGDVARFSTVRELVAWAGLDPHEDMSGDGVIRRGISHRGNRAIRAILYPLAMVCSQHNPAIRPFYERLVRGGKPKQVALIACMAKLLRIVYALLTTGRDFDPGHEAQRAELAAQERQKARSEQPPVAPIAASADLALDAPITNREARRRRAQNNATAPCPTVCEVEPQRGSGAVANALSAPVAACKRRTKSAQAAVAMPSKRASCSTPQRSP